MDTTATTTTTPTHVTVGQASTVHIALVMDRGAYAGEILGAACAWYGSSGPRKRVRVTTAPLTCKKCLAK